MGGIFGNLTKPNSAVDFPGGGTEYYPDVQHSAKAVAQNSAPQPAPVSFNGQVSPEGDTTSVTMGDVPTVPIPSFRTPSFKETSIDRSTGNVKPLSANPSRTKLGSLMTILMGGAQGGIDAIQGGALDAPIHGESNFGKGLSAAFQMPMIREADAQNKQIRQAQIQNIPIQQAAQRVALQNAIDQQGMNRARTKLYQAQAEAAQLRANSPEDLYAQKSAIAQKYGLTPEETKEFVLGIKPPTPSSSAPHTVQTAEGVKQWDPATKTWVRIGGLPKTVLAGAPVNPVPVNPTLSGDDFLNSIPADKRTLVKGIANYEIDPSKSSSMRTGERAQLMSWVKQYDPTYDQSQYQSRTKFRQDMTSGNFGRSVRSLNTAVAHLQNLFDSVDKLNNSNWHIYNTVWNWLNEERGKPEINNFRTTANAVESEMANVFKGTGATDQEIKAWRERLNTSQSPAELKGAISQLLELMGGRLGALADQYKASMGKPKDFRLLSDKSARILRKIGGDGLLQEDSIAGYGGAAPAQPASNPHSDIGFVPIQ